MIINMKFLIVASIVSLASAFTPSYPDGWPANGYAPSRDTLIDLAAKQVEGIIKSPYLESNCSKCIAGLEAGKFLALTYPDIVPDVLQTLCNATDFYTFSGCNVTFGRYTTAQGNSGTDVTNLLKLADVSGLDGQYICHYLLDEACPLPETPKFNISSWWPARPSNLSIPISENKTFNVVHVSDLHVDPSYLVGAEANCSQYMCCNSHNFNTHAHNGSVLLPASEWGSYKCDVPPKLLNNSLQSIAALAEQNEFEFAIFTGDMVDHDDDDLLSLAYTIESETIIYRSLKESLKGIPVYATLGNHDCFPYGQLAQESSGFYNMYTWDADLAADLWADTYNWVSKETGNEIRSHYAAFSTTTSRGLKVISINSNFWYLANYYNFWNTDQPDQSGIFKFLSDELVASEKINQRVWIIAHVPTGGGTTNTLPPPANVFGQIVERFSPYTIAGIFFGHTHEDQFNVYYASDTSNSTSVRESAENALNVAWLVQSITPLTDYNPGWRYYEVDTKTFSIIDSVNYYMPLNVSIANNNSEPTWQFGYSARKAYDPNSTWPSNAPLNGSFWHQVTENIYNDKPTRDLYLANEYRYSPYVPTCDNLNCRNNMYCFFTSGTVDDVLNCQKTRNVTETYFKRR